MAHERTFAPIHLKISRQQEAWDLLNSHAENVGMCSRADEDIYKEGMALNRFLKQKYQNELLHYAGCWMFEDFISLLRRLVEFPRQTALARKNYEVYVQGIAILAKNMD